MNHRGPLSRLVALTLSVALTFVFTPAVVADDAASLAGTVVTDGTRALDGAVVHAGDARTGSIVQSVKTADDGSFSLDGLPSAVYEIAVETADGLYVAGAPVPLEQGQHRVVQVAIHAQAAPDPASSDDDDDGLTFWDNPLTSALLIIGGAVVVGALVSAADDDSEGIASPFK